MARPGLPATSSNRLIAHAGARRVVFLVDRRTLGRQALNEFQQFTIPGGGRKFTEIYNVQFLSSNTIDPVCRVAITTIQRLFSILKGEPEFDAGNEEDSAATLAGLRAAPAPIERRPETLSAFSTRTSCRRLHMRMP